MIKYLTRYGNSHAFVIDQALMELLNATPETPFEVISDGRSIVLTPVHEQNADEKFEEALQDVHKRFGNAMKKLAE